MSLWQRFREKVEVQDNGCWLWKAFRDQRGYGAFWFKDHMRYAHRIAFFIMKGSLDEEKEVDHLCRNPGCCNPFHLEEVTHKENVKRGKNGVLKIVPEMCRKGHLYTEKNTYIHMKDGQWQTVICRECHRQRTAKYYARRRRMSGP